MLALKLALHAIHPFDNFRPPVTPIDQFANVELVIGCALFILFTLFYGFRFRWYKTFDERINWAGIAIFSMFLSISVLLVFSVLSRVLTIGDYPFRDVLRALVHFLLPAAGSFMFVALFVSREQMLRELRAHTKYNGAQPYEIPHEDSKESHEV